MPTANGRVCLTDFDVTADQTKHPCGAPTLRGGRCRNLVAGPGRCRLHGGPAAAPLDETSDLAATDPARRLSILQNAAEHRALQAHRAAEDAGSDKADAVFCRNARLAASLARLRHSLSRADKEEKADAAKTVHGAPPIDGPSPAADVTIYRLPDNGRDPEKG